MSSGAIGPPPGRGGRLGKPTKVGVADVRSPARHDYDRILYSIAFRRLAGVTQVLTPTHEGFLVHNRLTHSLKVAQLARSIAELLGEARATEMAVFDGVDADAAEAAALAHDLGHPPFGHIGETVLDDYARRCLGLTEGFEGNAQTFRIVTRLEPRSSDPLGLDLAAVTRAAILKYPWKRAEEAEPDAPGSAEHLRRLRETKFGVYADDMHAFETARQCVPYAINGRC